MPIYRKGDRADLVTREAYHLANYLQTFIQQPAASVIPYAEEIIRYLQCGSDATSQLLIIYSAFVEYLRRNGNISTKCFRYSLT